MAEASTSLPPLNLAAPGSLSHLQWRATEWLLAFGPLRPEIVLDYFCLSPFFDRTSNNAALRMQMQFSRGGMQGIDEEFELKRFVGTEYALVHAAPPKLFIIQKRTRTSPTEATPTAVYYILNDNIYQGPSLYTVLNERILTSIHHLSKSISLIQAKKPSWSPTNIYNWDLKPPPASTLPASAPDEADPTSTSAPPPAAQGVESLEGAVRGESMEEDDVERPANAFNPLLFRALQSLAAPPPPPQIPPPEQGKAEGGAGSQANSASNTRPGTPAVVGAEGAAVNGSAEKGEKKGVRIGPTGKRKPKNAA